jgi:ABC-2 type transport system ATP-binding protein
MGFALEVVSAQKSFGRTKAVDNLSFSVNQGEIFGLLGPNGAGKSTTINMTCGVTRLDGGVIRIFGHDVDKDYLLTRRMTGVMHQEVVIDTFFTVDRALKLHAGFYGYKDDPVWRKTLIDRLALGSVLDKKPIQLSGGTKRRLMLAKALIHKPRFVILDEPTAGVDVELRHIVWNFVREINKLGTTVLLTTHYLEEAEQMCERVAIMNQGQLVALERTQDLIRKIGDSRLLLRIEPALQEIPDSLKALNAELSEQGHLLQIPIKESGSFDKVLSIVQGLNIRVVDVENKKAGLEDVFLKLTGGRHGRL